MSPTNSLQMHPQMEQSWKQKQTLPTPWGLIFFIRLCKPACSVLQKTTSVEEDKVCCSFKLRVWGQGLPDKQFKNDHIHLYFCKTLAKITYLFPSMSRRAFFLPRVCWFAGINKAQITESHCCSEALRQWLKTGQTPSFDELLKVDCSLSPAQ